MESFNACQPLATSACIWNLRGEQLREELRIVFALDGKVECRIARLSQSRLCMCTPSMLNQRCHLLKEEGSLELAERADRSSCSGCGSAVGGRRSSDRAPRQPGCQLLDQPCVLMEGTCAAAVMVLVVII
mmetsp:Transcript_8991/g.23241  ORF Transcript_8991/g.23241 Transcript_8991/m.23241 type:complete len:130 (+) Transcript_8991:438-827(+)